MSLNEGLWGGFMDKACTYIIISKYNSAIALSQDAHNNV